MWTEYDAEVAAQRKRGGRGDEAYAVPMTGLSFTLEGYSADVTLGPNRVPVIRWTPREVALEADDE